MFKPPSTKPTRNWKHFQGWSPFRILKTTMRAGQRTGQGGRGAIGVPDLSPPSPPTPGLQHRDSGIALASLPAQPGLGQARRAPRSSCVFINLFIYFAFSLPSQSFVPAPAPPAHLRRSSASMKTPNNPIPCSQPCYLLLFRHDCKHQGDVSLLPGLFSPRPAAFPMRPRLPRRWTGQKPGR